MKTELNEIKAGSDVMKTELNAVNVKVEKVGQKI